MNLEKRGDYMLLYYKRRRFRIKCSCSIAFLRNVEPQGSAEYNAAACFVPLNEEAGYKRMVNWPIFRDSLALGNGDNY